MSAMEHASAAEFAEIGDVERTGLGTPATRAGVLEKLVRGGFLERKGRQLLPTKKGFNLIVVLPDAIKSAHLTAQLEAELKAVERGEQESAVFLDGMKENLQKHQAELANLLQQTEDAKVEVKRPFPQEAELAEKSNRLNVLNVALNIGGKDAPKDRERQRHDGKTSIKRLLRRMGVESAASASAPKKETDLEVAI